MLSISKELKANFYDHMALIEDNVISGYENEK